jgi:hypothetical protein
MKTIKTNQDENQDTKNISKPGILKRITGYLSGTWVASAWQYTCASLKVVDIAARIITAAALYLKLNVDLLNWGAAFLAATAIWEIVVAIIQSQIKNRQ